MCATTFLKKVDLPNVILDLRADAAARPTGRHLVDRPARDQGGGGGSYQCQEGGGKHAAVLFFLLLALSAAKHQKRSRR